VTTIVRRFPSYGVCLNFPMRMNVDSEDENYFDLSNVELGTDDGYFDTYDGMTTSSVEKTSKLNILQSCHISHSVNDFSSGYTQLQNFAGLSSPLSLDGQASQKSSVISSLSSLSHDDFIDNSTRQPSLETIGSEDANDFHPMNSNKLMKGLAQFTKEDVFSSGIFQSLFNLTDQNKPDNPTKILLIDKKESDSIFKSKTRRVEQIVCHTGSIWAMKISPSGSFLCTAGQDSKVIVWHLNKKVCLDSSSNPHEIRVEVNENISFIFPVPFRVFEGHASDVIDIAWSKSNFILSASTDKTVRLWHVTRNDCLQYFRHPDIVTSVDFHPSHDRYFISGCFDRRLRLWDIIPDGNVREWAQTPDTVR
jgi:WD40 repeat protein